MSRQSIALFFTFILLAGSTLTGCGDSLEDNPEWHVEQGIAFEQGDYEAAMLEYDEAIRLDPEYARAYYDRGTIYSTLGQYEQAILEYDEAIRLDPKDVWAFGNRGSAYLDLGQYQRALQDYDEAIRLDPEEALNYANRMLAYTMLNMDAEAEQDFNRAVELGIDRDLLTEEIAKLNIQP
jgi:tetratricopeptide (TPR) repeat protein